ncbi:MFS transporter [Vibrio navarrensis]|uniref:MFS transporter n=2 Tax=Vibrio navarrensis TaxID=29495 RepID=UPI0012AD7F77|nr:MFS transporter [Vibrio navarrensis]
MLFSRRFFPYFCTQCLGALNDNVYKNILLLMVTYSQLDSLPMPVDLFVNLAAGLFILPFLLFSAHAGQIADHMDKARLIRRLKIAEFFIMGCAAVAILTQSPIAMLVLLFLTGTQSAYFGPVKYSLLPQALLPRELIKGNAWVEMGTFISILTGTLTAGLLIALDDGLPIAAGLVLALSLIGVFTSRLIPSLPASTVGKGSFQPISALITTLKNSQRNRGIWMAILAISWFWFLGATYLTQFPNFAKIHLHADSTVVSLLLALFSIGIAAGSWLCEKLSFDQVELGILPFGIAGLTLFGIDLLLALPQSQPLSDSYWQAGAFIAQSAHWRVMFDLFMVGVSGGLFVVPLYAFIQSRAEHGQCAQAIAANNIMNSLFMVASAALAILLLTVLGLSIVQLFALLAVVNLIVAVYVYRQVPEFTQRFFSYLLSHLMYRVTIRGRELIPQQGAALLVANHVSYVDALILIGVSPRPVRFVMAKEISEIPLLKPLFRHAGVIPICSPKKCRDTYQNAFQQIDQALNNGEVVCLFPEGRLTTDGLLGEFRPGVEKILQHNPVKVIPVGLVGLWGSFFSHKNGHACTKRPSRFWSKVSVNIGEVVSGDVTDRHQLFQQVQNLLAQAELQ